MRRLLLSFSFLFFSFLLIAGGSQKAIQVRTEGNDFILTFNLPAVHLETVKKGNRTFQRVFVEGAGVNTRIGQAELPLFAVNVALPGTKTPELRIVEQRKKELKLNHPIYPVQMPWPKNRPLSERPFSMDESWYASVPVRPEPVSAGTPFVIRGTTGTTIVIRPFYYNPVNGTLEAITRLTVRGHFVDNVKGFHEPSAPAFRALFHRIFINRDELERSETGVKMSGNTKDVLRKYLIITAPEFESDLSDFVAHKESLGYAVTVVTTTVTGTTTSAIKSYLQEMYNDLETRPEFVLLVGDTNKIPAWTSTQADNPRNDLYYSTLDGADYFPDVFLGRFSISNSQELHNIISKTIDTESHLADLPKKVLFMASNDHYTVTEGTHNYVDSQYFTPDGYEVTKLYNRLNPGTAATSNAINGGERFAIYSGHGDWNMWADGPVFYEDNVRALTNDIYPFVFSFACLTGKYELSECFGETWIRVEKGGTTFWGSSVYSYWDEDDVLEKGVFKAAFADGLDQICPMFDAGKMALYDHYAGGGSSKRYFEQYNLLGDPSVYTKGTLPNSSRGRILLDVSKVSCSGQVVVQVWDSDREEEFFNITVTNPGNGDSREIELYKFDSGKYAGLYPFSVQGLDPGVSGSGELVFHYNDEHYGDEGQQDVTATLTLDCDGPALLHREVVAARNTSGEVSLCFDEKCYADITVKNGGTVVSTYTGNGVDSVDLVLSDLSPATAYTADLQLTDEVGNISTFTDVPLFTTSSGDLLAEYPCDDESEATHSAVTGADVWTMTTSANAHSNGKCWFGKDVPTSTDASLVVGPVPLPSDQGAVLSFWHYYNLESTYDGGVLEISTDNGNSWQDIGNNIQIGGYSAVMDAGTALEGQMAWTGSNDAMSQVFVDLSDFSGESVYFRFRIVCDSSVNQTGWYVDDIAVNSISYVPDTLTFLNLNPKSVLTVNTAGDSADLTLTARDLSGETLGTLDVSLDGYSVLNGTVETIFDPIDVSSVATVDVAGNAFISGWQMNDFEDTRGAMRNWTPAYRGKGAPAVLVPHIASDVVHGELYWNTWLSVMNSGNSAEALQFTYTPPFLPFVSDAQVPALGFIHVNVESDIFGGNFPESGVGFASLALPDSASGKLMAVKAMESFDKKTVANSAQLTLDMKAGKKLYVAHVDNSDYWWTGIALDNFSTERTASVSVSGYSGNGVFLQKNDYTVAPGDKLIFVTKDEFPENVAWLKVEADIPLIGYELFGTTNNQSMAGLNIPAEGARDIFLPVVDVELANDWYGLTILNPNEAAVDVTLYFYKDGALVGQKSVSLPALNKTVGLLGDYFSGQADLIEVSATGNVVAFCLEGAKDHSTLGGVLGMAK